MKHFIKSALIAAVLGTISIHLYAQTAHSISKKQIVNNCWQAIFGKLKNEAVQSISVEVFVYDKKIPNRMFIQRPDKFRNEVSSGILVFDGQKAAWVQRYPDKKGNPRKPEILDQLHWPHFEIDIALIFPAFFQYEYEYRGIKTINGQKYYEIYVKLPKGAYLSYFIDPKDFLIKIRRVSWQGNPHDKLWENIIDEYLDYNGIKFPSSYSFMGEKGMEKGIYKNFKINIKPDPQLFTIPEELE